MTPLDMNHLRQWIGKSMADHDVLSVRHARLMAATVGRTPESLDDGMALPPLWHWIYFLEGRPPAELGRDGHAARGGFLPPVPLSNRMWAGGRLEFHAPLVLGKPVEKHSSIVSVEHKQGRSGDLVFVAVQHVIRQSGQEAVREIHDIVYKEPSPPNANTPSPKDRRPSQHSKPFEADSTLLFRYSALTFNGHRIHYDADYCRNVEGYPNLVIHGPLCATLLAGYAEEVAGRRLKTFEYRALRPNLLGDALSLNASAHADGLSVWMAKASGAVSMQAHAAFH
ncbi:MaoC family dehydratase N-terminal domain-containing protein [Castellaniella sp.]|uniref:FAS1-like dehydratase domain-containing protein n=1 Tax=Castellaniella sp. TaxID=1955812 RepID=UPI0035618E54